jgi:hypothetical protein
MMTQNDLCLQPEEVEELVAAYERTHPMGTAG